jgi:hypothetical protein
MEWVAKRLLPFTGTKGSNPPPSSEESRANLTSCADDYRAAGAGIEESNPAQDQRAHDALAELGLFDHQIPQPPRRDDERLGGFGGNGIEIVSDEPPRSP